ncbi:MAG TPA: hypothetical protein VMV79_08215, partial [Alphaproteobacteria bacterium]|nr:hypothetical protein [Alphaproteobacteria bacterium]
QDNFIKKMQQSAAELMRYRIQQIPKQEDPAKEAISENLRSRVMSLPTTWGSFGRFMSDVRRSLKKYYEAGKEGRYGQFVITVERVQQTLAIYGWDRSFVLQDDFEEALRQDMSALTAYRLQRFPIRNDPIEEAQAAERRDKTKLLPSRSDYAASARRMSSLCQCLGKYFEVGEKNATYGSYFITADRVEQIFQIYGWDKSFVLQSRKPSVSRNDFEENLKQDAAALAAYRLQKFPIKDDPLEELEAARARLEIRLLPHRQRGFERVADRMNTLRRCLRLYFESEENDGYYDHYVITAIRVQQIFAIYGWNRDFILQDDFEETLKQDVVALNAYRMQRIPTKGNALEELQAARSRSEIKIIPAHSQGYVATARRMRSLWKGIKAYYEAGEREGKYEGYTVTANRVQQVFQLYGWNKEFVCSDIRHRSGGGGKSRKNHYHTLPEPSDFWGPPACTRFNRIPDAFPKPII